MERPWHRSCCLVPKSNPEHFIIEKEGESLELEPFQTVVLCSGMLSMPRPDEELKKHAGATEVIGDAAQVLDIYSAIHAGYDLAATY